MGRMTSLSSKSLWGVFLVTAVVMLCCSPLLYILMEREYGEEIDEMIEYRRDEFLNQRLSSFTIEDIDVWNRYNEDITILPYDKKYPVGIVREEYFFDKAEGHDIDYRVLYITVAIEGVQYTLMVRSPMIESHDIIEILVSQYGIIFLILIFSITCIYIYLSKRLWRPFYDTLSKIEDFRLESGRAPDFQPAQITEFNRLNERLSSLISQNLGIYRQQKEFIENASHELQTPLAVFKSQLDMLLQHPDIPEAQLRNIQSLYAVSSRMGRLNKNLLMLAKMDNEQYHQRESVDVVQCLYGLLTPLRDMAESNGLTVNVEVNDALVVDANKTLLESMLGNLIVNAIRHNVPNGKIFLSITRGWLSVSNTATDGPLDPEVIFRRFNHTPDRTKGNGLGMSIVRQISVLHNWDVTYRFAGNMHIFTVDFSRSAL